MFKSKREKNSSVKAHRRDTSTRFLVFSDIYTRLRFTISVKVFAEMCISNSIFLLNKFVIL